MMWKLWSNISYMVQILMACMIFIIPARKREHSILRLFCSIISFLLISYVLSLFHDTTEPGNLAFHFWILYILSAMFFIWMNIKSTFLEAAYCGICACGVQHMAFDFYMIFLLWDAEAVVEPLRIEKPGFLGSILAFLIFLGVYLLAYFLFTKKLVDHGNYTVQKDAAFPLGTMILLVWGISILELSALDGFSGGRYNHIIYRIMDALCCFYVLWVQINQKERMYLQRELDGINAAARQQQLQYKMTSETIDSINRRCHDLKHQIRSLRHLTTEGELQNYLNEIENDVMIYDVALKTGNKALDTVLMEKGLYCKEHGIQWTCMADGRKLDFMKLEDIYAIFGNALDNAVRAVNALDDSEKRVIMLKMVEQNQLLMIQIQNYYEGKLYFEEGLPLTTKKNRVDHGFGMKSIRYIVEKYDGVLTIQAKDQIFILQIMFPISQYS